MGMYKLEMECNLSTVRDGRGGIFTFYPQDLPIVEWNLIITRAGANRGFHYHEEFQEYSIIVEGHGLYVSKHDNGESYSINVAEGDCITLPPYTPHAFYAVTEVKMVAMLTKRWNDCDRPIVFVDFDEEYHPILRPVEAVAGSATKDPR